MLQSVLPGVNVLLIQSVPPYDVLGIWETQLGVSPNVHSTQQDLCKEGTDQRLSNKGHNGFRPPFFFFFLHATF